MSDKVTKIHEYDVRGCHVAVEKIGVDHLGEAQYAASVSYKAHNTNGVHVASPQWDNIGNEESTKRFIMNEVKRAQPVIHKTEK